MVAAGVNAARDLDVDGEIAAAVAFVQIGNERGPFTVGMRIVDVERVEAERESADVRIEQQRSSVVNRDDFVNGVAEQEATIERRDPGLIRRQEFAVQIGSCKRSGLRGGLRSNDRLGICIAPSRSCQDPSGL